MRESWDDYYMGIARQASTRATCNRGQVGAVVVRGKSIVTTGYNGSLPGEAHCTDAGCMMEDGHCVRTVHAEANAVAQAARYSGGADGCTLYTTWSPCWPCFKLLAAAGIKRVVYGKFYRDRRIFEYAERQNIELVGPGLQEAPT